MLDHFGSPISCDQTCKWGIEWDACCLVGAVTAIELVTRYMLVRPLLQGAFLSDSWAKILAKHITQVRMAQ
jgi:hypothetical protein